MLTTEISGWAMTIPEVLGIRYTFFSNMSFINIVLRSLHQVCTKVHVLLLIVESVRFANILYIFYKMTWSSGNGD